MSIARSVSRPISRSISRSVMDSCILATGLLLDNLVAYWDLSEASGSRLDSHTNGYNLTDVNTVSSGDGVGGPPAVSADFIESNNEYFSSTMNTGLDGTIPFSRVIWVNSDDAITKDSLISSLHSSGINGHRIQVSTNKTVTWWCANTSASDLITSTDVITTGSWSMIYGAYDGTELKISINDGTVKKLTAAGTYLGSNQSSYFFGRDAGGNYLNGLLQSAGFWDRELTAAEITWLYNSGSTARLYSDVAGYTG